MKKIIGFGGVIGMLIFMGCASLSNYQTAEVLPKGVACGGIGIGNIYWKNFWGEAFENPDLKTYAIDFWSRAGIWKNLDIGGKLTIPFTGLVDIKYQILPDKIIAVAPSLGFGYAQITSEEDTTTIMDFYSHIYVSKKVLSWITFYGTPKFIYTISAKGGESKPGAYKFGGGGGIFLGKENKGLWLDGSYLIHKTEKTSNPIIFYGVGISYAIQFSSVLDWFSGFFGREKKEEERKK